ncbi:P-loop containing nucleoside triphosphate hydrolase protein [Mrakia frigida]|uniref:DEAD/DEAH box helicase n=1 Tax=Mrakia frigida TaxID=29902 RepID=UPI003FCC11D9
MSGSETEDDDPIVKIEPAADDDDDTEEDLDQDEAWKKDYPELCLPQGPTSQNSQNNFQGSQQRLSLSQRQQQHTISLISAIKPTLASLPNSFPSNIAYLPVEATPYTPEQLARGALPLTKNQNGASVPQPLNRLLREYQRDGVRFLHQCWEMGRGGILGDDMGLGKTIQVISFLSAIMGKTGLKSRDDLRRTRWTAQMKADGSWKPGIRSTNPKPGSKWPTALIVAPTSVCYNWARELSNWGYFSVGVYSGTEKSRILQEYKMGWYDIIIVGFETVSDKINELFDLDWGVIIADEVHRIKNPRATWTINLHKFHCKVRLGLTGTAIQNKLEEFWTILNWSCPEQLGTLQQFKEYISEPLKVAQASDASAEDLAIGRQRAQQWKHKILPKFFIRRTKAIIAHQLPKKRDFVVSCVMTRKQIECFHRLRETEDVQLMIRKDEPCDCLKFKENGEKKPRKECCYKFNVAGVAWNDLIFKYVAIFRKVANHLALVIPSEDDTPQQKAANKALLNVVLPDVAPEAVRYHEQSLDPSLCGKWPHLKHFLETWRPNHEPNKNKVLIFSMSVKLLKILEFFIDSAGYKYLFMHGGVESTKRMGLVDQFQNDPNQYIFLISTLTGGVGLNLTAANKVVIFDPSWNPANDLQAMDRAFRIGQTNDVEVYRLLAGGSIEETIYARQIYKRQSASIGYDASMEKRNFTGIMGDKNHEGELFGLKNLFSLREDALGMKDTAQRVFEAEIEVKGIAAGHQFDETKEELQFSQDDDINKPDFNSILNMLNGTTDEKEENEIAKLLDANGATFYHQDNLFLGDNKVERHAFRAARKLMKERPHEAKTTGAWENAVATKVSPLKKKKTKRDSDGPPAKKKATKMKTEDVPSFAPAARPSIIAKAEAEEETDDEKTQMEY